MWCPYCGHENSRVTDSRSVPQSIRRRRRCLECGARFTTQERVENTNAVIIKKDRRRERFNREKLLRGILRACEKRPLPTGAIEKLVDDIEAELYRMGKSEISSSVVGEMVMERLLKLDHIAYIRFASVYRAFADIGSLKKEVDTLAARHEVASQLPLMSRDNQSSPG
ncbi:MAG: transcriptional regulator NrdR [Dehalococcoidia bacterium]|nr:Transcriptional repressor NrdR [Chloroflexota bacterium]MBT9159223.1 Transcriptional repressor NrdR [Chloroflexota bacterium]MBT9161671.1 Transcriptional repressor NrdR [Chloroflexota bacterium]